MSAEQAAGNDPTSYQKWAEPQAPGVHACGATKRPHFWCARPPDPASRPQFPPGPCDAGLPLRPPPRAAPTCAPARGPHRRPAVRRTQPGSPARYPAERAPPRQLDPGPGLGGRSGRAAGLTGLPRREGRAPGPLPRLTFWRIWPDVDTLRMSFCGEPGSASGSLSDDSSGGGGGGCCGEPGEGAPAAAAMLPGQRAHGRWGRAGAGPGGRGLSWRGAGPGLGGPPSGSLCVSCK